MVRQPRPRHAAAAEPGDQPGVVARHVEIQVVEAVLPVVCRQRTPVGRESVQEEPRGRVFGAARHLHIGQRGTGKVEVERAPRDSLARGRGRRVHRRSARWARGDRHPPQVRAAA